MTAEETIRLRQGSYELLDAAPRQHSRVAGDLRLSEAIKRRQPADQSRLRWARTSAYLPEKSLAPGRPGHRTSLACARVRPPVVEYANGKPRWTRSPDSLGLPYREERQASCTTTDRPQIENLDALPHVTDVYRAGSRRSAATTCRSCQHPFRGALHYSRLPGAVLHVLLCGRRRSWDTSVAQALSTDDVSREMAKAKEILAVRKGVLLRRRHVQHPEGSHRSSSHAAS